MRVDYRTSYAVVEARIRNDWTRDNFLCATTRIQSLRYFIILKQHCKSLRHSGLFIHSGPIRYLEMFFHNRAVSGDSSFGQLHVTGCLFRHYDASRRSKTHTAKTCISSPIAQITLPRDKRTLVFSRFRSLSPVLRHVMGA